MKKFTFMFLVAVLCIATFVEARSITPTGMNQGDLVAYLTLMQTRVNQAGEGATLTYPNVHKHADGSTTVDIGTTFTYSIGDYLYSKTASDTIASVSASAQATGTSALYLLSLDSTGSVTTTAGTAVTYGSTPAWPSLPASSAPFGGIRVDILSDATAGFTLGTTAFNYDASATVTVYNLGMVPDSDLDITNF